MLVLMLWKSPAPRVATDPEASRAVQIKIASMQRAIQHGLPGKLELGEAELNSFLASNLALEGKPPVTAAPGISPAAPAEPTVEQVQSTVRDVKITLKDDHIAAWVLFDFHGKDLSLELEGKLRAVEGYLQFDVTRGALGSLPIPQSSLDSAMKRLFDSPENREKLRLPPGVSDVRIENGRLIVVYE